MRKSRIVHWLLCLVIALGFYMGEGWFREIMAEKSPLYVYAPSDMKSAFKTALNDAGLKSDYEIVITDDASKANIVVETDKEFDSEYTKIAYTPFVVVYSQEDDNIKRMIKSDLLQDAFFNNSYKEINFNKVVQEVVEEGKWENLGVKDMGHIKVYYPAPDTEYYSDYYNFMLVTVNGGVYPKSEDDLKKAIEQIERFENSDYTEAVSDFDEKIDRTGGFLENTLYLVPEKVAKMLANHNSKYGRLFYPTTTVYVNYYVKADELGSKLVAVFDATHIVSENFYEIIENYGYRNSYDNELGNISDYLCDERDVYNVLHLDAERLTVDSLKNVKQQNPNDTNKNGD